MARETSTFVVSGGALANATELTEAQARGTVRIALRKGGLDPSTVTKDQMLLVLERILPHELRLRGYEDAETICRGIARALDEAATAEASVEAPEEILRRLFGR